MVKLQVTETTCARTRAELRRYKVEPYVIAADIYAASHHVGDRGWTWYTGSAGWMQRAGLESILGIQCEGSSLHIDPCISNSWPEFEIGFAAVPPSYTLRSKIRKASHAASRRPGWMGPC